MESTSFIKESTFFRNDILISLSLTFIVYFKVEIFYLIFFDKKEINDEIFQHFINFDSYFYQIFFDTQSSWAKFGCLIALFALFIFGLPALNAGWLNLKAISINRWKASSYAKDQPNEKTKMESKNTHLEAINSDLTNEKNTLEQEITNLTEKRDVLKEENDGLTKENKSESEKLKELRSKVEVTENKIELTNKIVKLKNANEDLKSHVMELESRLEELEKEKKKVKLYLTNPEKALKEMKVKDLTTLKKYGIQTNNEELSLSDLTKHINQLKQPDRLSSLSNMRNDPFPKKMNAIDAINKNSFLKNMSAVKSIDAINNNSFLKNMSAKSNIMENPFQKTTKEENPFQKATKEEKPFSQVTKNKEVDE